MSEGDTPLIISAYLGNASCVEQLLSHSNIDTTLVFQGHTAFHWCQADSRADGWEFLEKDINMEGRVKIVQLLTETGAH
jgi:ankyrin repeat protein